MLESIFGFDATWIIVGLVILFAAMFLWGLISNSYVVVPPHQAHVVVDWRGRHVYPDPDDEARTGSTYLYIPLIMTRNIVPLEQIQINIKQIELHDKDVAPFQCDIVAWVIIDEAKLASERLGDILTDQDIRRMSKEELVRAVSDRISTDIEPLVCSVSRTSSMKVTVLELMQDRKKFSLQVEEDIDVSLTKWGMSLTDLEVLHISDVPGQEVIGNLEKQKAKVIEAETRLLVADKEREASIAESEAEKETELTVAENRETFRKRQIEADEKIEMAQQDKIMAIAEREKEANDKAVEALRVKEVGTAKVEAEAAVEVATGAKLAAIQTAEGQSQAALKIGAATAEVTTMTGEAEAAATLAKKTADAEGKKASLLADAEGIKMTLLGEAEGLDKKADAQAKLQEGATMIEMINAAKEIKIAEAMYTAEAVKSSEMKIYAGGIQEVMGFNIGPQQGGNLGATISGLMDALPDGPLKEKAKSLLGAFDEPQAT